MEKKLSRLRRSRRARIKIRELEMHRLCVHRTPKHIYAQVIDSHGDHVLVAASTVEKSLRESVKGTGNIEAAKVVGKVIAEKARNAGIDKVAFDRSGFKYHGRIRALAEAARENGLEF
jgi:large subunit ribosomal protein L18